MALIMSFRDLDVYKLVREQAKKIFVITKSFPREERYSLIDQIRRSSGRSTRWSPRLGQDGDIALPS